VTSLLDNPVWHALTGPHAHLAVGQGAARQYPRDMAPFSAVAEPSAEAYADLAADLPLGVEARLFRPGNEPAPPGWQAISAKPIQQMAPASLNDAPGPQLEDSSLISLGQSDAADMVALADAGKPGPFGPRTVELGRYIGVRDAGGRLVAMAGERFCLPGHVELSAICVHPEARGRGLGAALTSHLARDALARGEEPFLHVFPENPAAALYQRIGFQLRATLWVIWMRPISGPAR
jgi:ribosomal protein S18 acetylase RimI-like enzyme